MSRDSCHGHKKKLYLQNVSKPFTQAFHTHPSIPLYPHTCRLCSLHFMHGSHTMQSGKEGRASLQRFLSAVSCITTLHKQPPCGIRTPSGPYSIMHQCSSVHSDTKLVGPLLSHSVRSFFSVNPLVIGVLHSLDIGPSNQSSVYPDCVMTVSH